MTLYSIVLGMESKNVFEFGCGFSTTAILTALYLTGGKLITNDIRPLSENCPPYLDKSYEGVVNNSWWEFICASSDIALKDIVTRETVYDVILHDGSHTPNVVIADLKALLPKTKTGTIILLHDTNHPTANYRLDIVAKELDLPNITLPYGYGLTIMTVDKDFGNGSVNIEWRKN
jgi:cephalosporin hydroxylase